MRRDDAEIDNAVSQFRALLLALRSGDLAAVRRHGLAVWESVLRLA